MKFFADTCALIEFVKGNPKYNKYLDKEIFTGFLNLYEVYYLLSRDFDEETARDYFFKFRAFLIKTGDEHVFFASKLKLRNKKLSYADALGYAISAGNNMAFLTADKAFKGLEKVEFVKAG